MGTLYPLDPVVKLLLCLFQIRFCATANTGICSNRECDAASRILYLLWANPFSVPPKYSEIIMEEKPGAPPREQRKTDPGRRGCGLLETGTVVLFCFVFPRLWQSSSLLPLKSSPGSSSEGSKVPSLCLLSFLSLGEQSVEGRWSLPWVQVLAVG